MTRGSWTPPYSGVQGVRTTYRGDYRMSTAITSRGEGRVKEERDEQCVHRGREDLPEGGQGGRPRRAAGQDGRRRQAGGAGLPRIPAAPGGQGPRGVSLLRAVPFPRGVRVPPHGAPPGGLSRADEGPPGQADGGGVLSLADRLARPLTRRQPMA